MSNLIPDGTRSAHRCAVAGCATVPEGDRAICEVHAQALQRIPAVPEARFSHPESPRGAA